MKILLQISFFLIPFLATAQNPALYKDFSENIRDISGSFKLNDKVNVIQLNNDKDDFEIAAIDENMQVLWRTPLKGYGITCGKFKNKIVAVATSSYSMFTGPSATYNGFLIDAKTGKVELEKKIYDGTGQNRNDIKVFYTTDGSFFRMAVRETETSTGGASVFNVSRKIREFYQTKDLTIIDFNEKLEAASTFKPSLKEGTYVGITGNYHGDIFLASFLNNKTVQVSKYETGAKLAVGKLTEDIDLYNENDTDDPANHIKILASPSDRNAVYFAVMHKNSNREIQLTTCKLDYLKKTKQTTTEVFDKDHIKGIEKGFVRINKKIDKPDLGSASVMEVRYMDEYKSTLLVGMSGRSSRQGTYTSWLVEFSTVINGYDLNLKPKFQQVVPTYYAYGLKYLPTGFNAEGDVLHVIANVKDGLASIKAIYGQIDLTTGAWNHLDELSKKDLKGAAYADGENTLWYKNSFLAPYLAPGGLVNIKYDLSFQENTF